MTACLERKQTLSGKEQIFACDLVRYEPGFGILRHVIDREYDIGGTGLLPGDVTWGLFWEDRPYTLYIWNLEREGGRIHYFNVADSVTLSPEEFVWRDLAVDVLIDAAGDVQILDEHELPPGLSPDLSEYIARTKQHILSRFREILVETAGLVPLTLLAGQHGRHAAGRPAYAPGGRGRTQMTSPARNILITGLPGSGKTTLVRKLAAELQDVEPVGFFSQEIREGRARKGFGLTSFGGATGVLAHVDIPGPLRVGRYGVDIPGFERFLGSLPLTAPRNMLVILDEIGKMECLSPVFLRIVNALLDSDAQVVATVALKGSGAIERIKRRQDVELIELTGQNRDILVGDIAERVRFRLAS